MKRERTRRANQADGFNPLDAAAPLDELIECDSSMVKDEEKLIDRLVSLNSEDCQLEEVRCELIVN